MKIDKSIMLMQQIYFGWLMALLPYFYQKYLVKKNYVWIFFISQIAYVFADAIGILAGSRYNLSLGIPDIVLYVLSGNFAIIFEKGFSTFGCMSLFMKLIPIGVEATMSSITIALFQMSVFFFRSTMGVILNGLIFKVDENNLEEKYINLKILSAIGSCAPLIYMFYFIPTRQEANQVQ